MKKNEMIASRFADVIKSIRDRTGKSQQDVAENVGEIRQTIYEVENAKRGIKIESLFQLARAYDLSLPQVLYAIHCCYNEDPGVGSDEIAKKVLEEDRINEGAWSSVSPAGA